MRFLVIIVLVVSFLPFNQSIQGQETDQDIRIIRNIADHICDNTTFQFVDKKTGETYSSLENVTYSKSIKLKSQFNRWRYTNGVLNVALLELSDFLSDDKYKEFVIKNYQFAFDNYAFFKENHEDQSKWSYPFGQLFIMKELDDCGSMSAGLIDVLKYDQREEYRHYLDNASDHVLKKQERLKDGTLVRSFPHKMTLWADDLYMSVPFLARMGKLTGDKKYFNDAAKQVVNFTKYLFCKNTELYYHCYYSDLKTNGVAHWGRCNGWVMMAQVNLLNLLDRGHSKRETLISILFQHILGIAKYQDIIGLWHQILNKNDSYLESSCTAMFTYSIARAVNEGWIDKRYASIALRGWEGLQTKIRGDGQLEDICIGTGIREDMIFYYKRPKRLNESHGLGAVLLAGIEVIKLKRNSKSK
jgi:rhamnogalacturonyl hydrolase YesR